MVVTVVAMAAVIIMVATVVAMAGATVPVTLNLILIATSPLALKGGKIEAMEILVKTLNLKVEEVGEKGEFLAKEIPQVQKISILFL